MNATRTITRVTVRWDDQPGVEAGWYAESWAGVEMIDDSQKIWFPVSVDDYSHDQADELEEALAEVFPGAEIEFARIHLAAHPGFPALTRPAI